MKYFTRNIWVYPDKDVEVTPEKALGIYKLSVSSGLSILDATVKFTEGRLVYTINHRIWGEDITDKECFKRRLAGTLITE